MDVISDESLSVYLLSRIWYLAQILPPPARHVQHIMTACTCFIFRGAIFRVPTTTLQRPTAEGGWALMVLDVGEDS